MGKKKGERGVRLTAGARMAATQGEGEGTSGVRRGSWAACALTGRAGVSGAGRQSGVASRPGEEGLGQRC